MTPKLLIAAVAALAIAAGFALPGPRDSHAKDRPQIAMQEIGRS